MEQLKQLENGNSRQVSQLFVSHVFLFVRSNPVTDTTHAWVRKAERQANQAKRQVYSYSIQAIPESAKVYSKSGKSFTVAPQYDQILNWNKQTAYNKIKDQAIEKRAQQIRNNRLKFGGIGLGILGTLPIAYNITSNKISGADENLNDQTSRMFDAFWGNTFGTRGHGSSDYKILKKLLQKSVLLIQMTILEKKVLIYIRMLGTLLWDSIYQDMKD